MDIGKAKERLIEIILDKTFKYSEDPPFTLVSGRKSNYYFNCKPTTLDPEGMNLIGEIVFAMLADADVTAAGGLTLGADPIANALSVISFQRGKPIRSFIVRREAKDHGTMSGIEGNVQPGDRVAILDDVITTGGSTIAAIVRAKGAGLVIDRVIALIDREEESGRANIEAHVPRVDAVLTRTEIMSRYRGKEIGSLKTVRIGNDDETNLTGTHDRDVPVLYCFTDLVSRAGGIGLPVRQVPAVKILQPHDPRTLS